MISWPIGLCKAGPWASSGGGFRDFSVFALRPTGFLGLGFGETCSGLRIQDFELRA